VGSKVRERATGYPGVGTVAVELFNVDEITYGRVSAAFVPDLSYLSSRTDETGPPSG
jgi:hypothetical protein